MKVRIVRPCEVCGAPTKRPNARYCSGAHADVAYRRRKEIERLCRLVDQETAALNRTLRRVLDLTFGGSEPTRPTSLFGDRLLDQIRRDRPSPIGKERS
jgi:hypothetical protein